MEKSNGRNRKKTTKKPHKQTQEQKKRTETVKAKGARAARHTGELRHTYGRGWQVSKGRTDAQSL